MDQCVGEVLQKLKDLGLYDSTLIVVMGDHGEGLGEHGEMEHGYYLYQSTTRVPLIIRAPGVPGGERVSQVVNLVDVMPTILGYLNVPIPHHVQGRDLSGPERGQADSADERLVYTESMVPILYGCNPLLSLVGNSWKYIDSTRPELYDLKLDPGERTNLHDSQPQRANQLRTELVSMVQQYQRANTVDSDSVIDAESVRRLKSLGYVAGEIIDPLYEIEPSTPDAKDLIVYYEACHKVHQLAEQNKHEQAYQLCLEIMEDFPRIVRTHFLLGEVSFLQNHWEQCISHMQAYVERDSKDTKDLKSRVFGFDRNRRLFTARQNMARSHHELAQYDRAEKHYRALLSFKTKQPALHRHFAMTLVELERWDEAIKHFQIALDSNPDEAQTHERFADVLFRLGRMNEAEQHLRSALRLKPQNETFRARLAAVVEITNQEVAITENLLVVQERS